MSGIDNYLTAVITFPRFVDPRQRIGWIADEQALMALAVRTLVANYNRISIGLANTAADMAPAACATQDGTCDAFAWSIPFLLATGYAHKL